jgi:hypothetical protein
MTKETSFRRVNDGSADKVFYQNLAATTHVNPDQRVSMSTTANIELSKRRTIVVKNLTGATTSITHYSDGKVQAGRNTSPLLFNSLEQTRRSLKTILQTYQGQCNIFRSMPVIAGSIEGSDAKNYNGSVCTSRPIVAEPSKTDIVVTNSYRGSDSICLLHRSLKEPSPNQIKNEVDVVRSKRNHPARNDLDDTITGTASTYKAPFPTDICASNTNYTISESGTRRIPINAMINKIINNPKLSARSYDSVFCHFHDDTRRRSILETDRLLETNTNTSYRLSYLLDHFQQINSEQIPVHDAQDLNSIVPSKQQSSILSTLDTATLVELATMNDRLDLSSILPTICNNRN